MAGKTNYFSDAVLAVIEGTNITAGATYYIGLFTVDPTDAYTGASPTGLEVTYSGATPATRQSVTASDGNWNNAAGTPAGRQISNANAIEWTNWQTAETIVAFGVFEAVSGGEMVYWAELDNDRTVGVGETLSFAADALTLTED